MKILTFLLALMLIASLTSCAHEPPLRQPVPELNPAYPGGQ